jgi:hypothetical protein
MKKELKETIEKINNIGSKLDLYDKNIGDEGTKYISETLIENNSLQLQNLNIGG